MGEIEEIDEENSKKAKPAEAKVHPKPKIEDGQIDQNIQTFLQTAVNLAVADYKIIPSKNGKTIVILDALGRPSLNVSLYLSDGLIENLVQELEK